MVDFGADRDVAFVWTTWNVGSVSFGAQPEQTPAPGAWLAAKGVTPCHATLTETLRAIDGRALAQALGAVCFAEGGDQRHIAIDGKTMRASKDGDGHATHVLSAFCAGLQSILGNEASRGKGMEIPDALKLLDQLDLKGKIVTGDAMFCQKSIVAKIAEKGGGYVFPVKDNQKNLRENIATAFNEPVFPPRLV